MYVLDIEQLSPEWFEARVGVPSASCFDKIVTSKGEPSKQAKSYLYQLAGETIVGHKMETYQNAAMQRGIELESEARRFYELMQDAEVKPVGICYPDEQRMFSCSPDGLVDDNGVIEIKCPLLHTHVEYLLNGKLPITYIQQVHGELLVTGREWCDFISYYPGMKPLIVRVKRNEKFLDKLKSALLNFCEELDETVAKLKSL